MSIVCSKFIKRNSILRYLGTGEHNLGAILVTKESRVVNLDEWKLIQVDEEVAKQFSQKMNDLFEK
jgi:hypothetical protein